jgi:hypothetical protein
MNRDELQEKAWQAWLSAPSARHGVNAVLEVAEPIIRADEREKRDAYWQGRLENAWVQLDEMGISLLAARAEKETEQSEYTRAQSGWGNQLHLPEDEKP